MLSDPLASAARLAEEELDPLLPSPAELGTGVLLVAVLLVVVTALVLALLKRRR